MSHIEEFICICGKKFKAFRSYKMHFEKYKCKTASQSGNLQTDNLILSNSMSPEAQLVCKYCNKTMLYKNLKRHQQSACKILKLQPILDIVKHNSIIPSNSSITHNNIGNTSSLTHNNIGNTANANYNGATYTTTNDNNNYVNIGVLQNNIQNIDNRNTTINIHINSVTRESTKHITKEDKMEIVSKIYRSFDKLLEYIYKDDQNKNIYFNNRNKREVVYIGDTGELTIGDADDIIGDIAMSHLNILDDIIDEYKDTITKIYQPKIEELIKYHSTEECNPGYIKKTEHKILSFKDYAKQKIKKYQHKNDKTRDTQNNQK